MEAELAIQAISIANAKEQVTSAQILICALPASGIFSPTHGPPSVCMVQSLSCRLLLVFYF